MSPIKMLLGAIAVALVVGFAAGAFGVPAAPSPASAIAAPSPGTDLYVVVDAATGCQYLRMRRGSSTAITPRIDPVTLLPWCEPWKTKAR